MADYASGSSTSEANKSSAPQSGGMNPQGGTMSNLAGSPVGAPNSYRSEPPGAMKRGPSGSSYTAPHEAPNQRKD